MIQHGQHALGSHIELPLFKRPTPKMLKDLTSFDATLPKPLEDDLLTIDPPTMASSEDLMLSKAKWVQSINLSFNELFTLIY